jgi:hypothetical protein
MSKKQTDLRDCYCKGVKPEIAYEYIIYTNENKYSNKTQTITGNDLHKIEGTSSDTHFIKMVTKKGKIDIGPNTVIDLTECGIERFIILPYQQLEIDLEDCFCKGVKPVITFKYLLKINREKYSTEKEKLSREEILQLAGKDPKTHRLRMFTKNGKQIIEEGQIIDLTECGVERFVYEEIDCTEGFLTTDFRLITESDRTFLSNLPNEVNIIHERNLNWIIIRDFGLLSGYNLKKADLAILIHPQYPTAQLDMIYFHPALRRTDGKPIGALTPRGIEGKVYQQWSRHRKPNVWDPEIDNVESHLNLMMNCLKAEFDKR